MIMNNILKTAVGVFEIKLDSNYQAQLVFDSVNLEIINSPSHRSKLEMFLKDSTIIIKISAEDSTSFRASLNYSIKLIILSIDILNL